MTHRIFHIFGLAIVIELLMHTGLYHLIRLIPSYASSPILYLPDWCVGCKKYLLFLSILMRLIILAFPLVSIVDSRVFSIPWKFLAFGIYMIAVYHSLYYIGNWVGVVIIFVTQLDHVRNFKLWLFLSAYCLSSLIDEFTHIYKWFYVDL